MGLSDKLTSLAFLRQNSRLRKTVETGNTTDLQAIHADGYRTGHADGYKQGHQHGWDAGWRAGQAELIEGWRTGRVRPDQL